VKYERRKSEDYQAWNKRIVTMKPEALTAGAGIVRMMRPHVSEANRDRSGEWRDKQCVIHVSQDDVDDIEMYIKLLTSEETRYRALDPSFPRVRACITNANNLIKEMMREDSKQENS